LQHATRNNSAPKVYRAGFRQPQTNAMPAAFVIVKQTDFYSDGAHLWAISTYRMTVLQPQPTNSNDNPRKAI
jgi:hypothetical protein